MKRVKNKKHGVINKVSDDKFEELMKTGEYEEYKSSAQKPNIEEAPKRKRRTKAEIEADKAKGK